MASTVYSHRAFCQLVTSSAPASYTVPTGYVFVLVDLEILGQSAVSSSWGAFLVVGGSNFLFIEANSLASEAKVQWQGRIVVNAGESLECSTPNGSYVAIASGYLLTTP